MTNFFALLGDAEDSEPSEILKKPPTVVQEKTIQKPVEKQSQNTNKKDEKKTAPKDQKPSPKSAPKSNGNSGRNQKSEKRGENVAPDSQEFRSDKPRIQKKPRSADDNAAKADRRVHREGDAHHKGDAKPRGRGGVSSGKRAYDRHDASGRVDSEKKDVAGKNVWGNALATDVQGDVEGEKDAAATAAEEQIVPAVTENEVEEKTITLDTYLASLSEKRLTAAVASRKPNEGIDDSKWKDTVILKKPVEELFSGKASKEKKVKETKASKKIAFDIKQSFADEENVTRDYKRGGQFGKTARNTPPVNVADKTLFPVLGK